MSAKTQKKYLSKFKDSYSKDFPCVIKSRKGDSFAFCSDCSTDISISHGGKNDIVAHLKTIKHIENVKKNKSNLKIENLFASSDDLSVIRAECLFTSFIIEHNIPLSCADHAGQLFRKMFPKSDVAKKYGSARTKSTAIMKLMAQDKQLTLISCLKKQPFSMATDGSNDNERMYPVVVTYCNPETGMIENNLLCAPTLEGNSTGRNIGNLLLSCLASRDIPVENCIAFGCDNANTMIGKKNGVAGVLMEAHNGIIIMGCMCHLIDLAAGRGVNSLPVNIDEILVDIYYYLKKSSKRKEKLKQFQSLHDTDMKDILKHVETRWLSMGRCLKRILEQWEPLLSFFVEENRSLPDKRTASDPDANLESYKIPKRPKTEEDELKKSVSNSSIPNDKASSSKMPKKIVKDIMCKQSEKLKSTASKSKKSFVGNTQKERICSFLSCDVNKAYCLFLQNTLPTLEKVCTFLQSQQPLVHALGQIIIDLFKELLSYFVKPEVVKNSSSPLAVKYHNRCNQKEDGELVIGSHTAKIVTSLQVSDKSIFFLSVRKYFIDILDYIHHSFPHKNETVVNADILNPLTISANNFFKLKFFIDKFPLILPVKENETNEEAMDILEKQFCELQIEELPESIVNDGRVDKQWNSISKIKNILGEKKYERVSQAMSSLLVIPHSNAECERIFSQIRKIKTDFRASLSNENLENLLILKCSKNNVCYEENFTPDFLKKAKSAAYLSLNSSCNISKN